VAGAEELLVLFAGLQALEEMIDVVRSTGEAPPLRPELVAELTRPVASTSEHGAAASDRAAASNQAAWEGGQAKKTVS
jgi:hypothetical protein